MMPDCIITTRSLDDWGYGRIWVGDKCWKENRWVFFQTYGYLPDVVMHTCDTPSCINPEHLVAGTVTLNNEDRMLKGRNGRIDGDRNGRAKITDQDAEEIRNIYSTGSMTQAELGLCFDITQSRVSRIVRGVSFKGSTKNSRYEA